jgi:hypothetical protein
MTIHVIALKHGLNPFLKLRRKLSVTTDPLNEMPLIANRYIPESE